MDLKEIHDSHAQTYEGQPPYHPAMLLAVLFGYMNNIFSTRGLESAMTRDAHLIWLSSYQFPDHTTISRFKTRCMLHIKIIFSRLVLILAERGGIKLTADLYIGGTTIRSRAPRRRIRWRRTDNNAVALSSDFRYLFSKSCVHEANRHSEHCYAIESRRVTVI